MSSILDLDNAKDRLLSNKNQLTRPSNRLRRQYMVGAACLVSMFVVLGLYFLKFRSDDFSPPGSPDQAVSLAPMVAVMPFRDLSPAQSEAYLAEDVAEELIHRLARSKNIVTIAHASSFSAFEKKLDFREVAEKLSAEFLVEGRLNGGGYRANRDTPSRSSIL